MSTKTITYNPQYMRLEIRFPFSFGMKEKVKAIPNSQFDWDEKVWYLPATKLHAGLVSKFATEYGFFIDSSVLKMGRTDIKINHKTRSKLFKYQVDGLDFLHQSGGRALLADSPGLGKTYQSIAYMEEVRPEKVLIVSPASVVYMWQDKVTELLGWETEIIQGYTRSFNNDARVLICSYAVFTNRILELKRMNISLTVYDECFPANTMVATDKGDITIKEIVDGKLDVSVLSCNLTSNAVEYKKVYDYVHNINIEPMVNIRHQYGTLQCTYNHPIFIEEENNYVKAGEIKEGSRVRILWEDFYDSQERTNNRKVLFAELQNKERLGKSRVQRESFSKNTKAFGSKDMSSMWKQVFISIKRFSKQQKKNLLQPLLCINQSVTNNTSKGIVHQKNAEEWEWKNWKEVSCLVRAYEEEQPNERPISEEKSKQSKQRKNFSFKGWKWEANQTTDGIAYASWWNYGVPHRHAKRNENPFSFITKLLQGGHRISRDQTSNRDRWEVTQHKEVEVSRPTERAGTLLSRVESVEVYQSTGGHQLDRGTEQDNYVYCIDVEDNHNFFANGVLVHNCHYLSNPKSQRTRSAKLLLSPNIIGLSGTPFLNRPKELFPILNILQPTIWSSYWKFVHRYCDAKLDGFGHWNFDGADNLSELRGKLEQIMLRRTKLEVLTELPSITKNYLPYLNSDRRLITGYKEAMIIAKETKGNVPNSKRFMQVRQTIGLMKVDAAVELAEDMLVDSGKIVLFAIHKAVVAQLEKRLSKYGLIKIVGDVPQKDRFDLVQRFQTNPDTRVAIISQAGGEGIDLFAANTLIFVEREWNPGKEEQIMGRVHRIGQTKSVTVHYIIAKNTIDERIHKIIETKSGVLSQVYTFDDIPVNDLLDVGV